MPVISRTLIFLLAGVSLFAQSGTLADGLRLFRIGDLHGAEKAFQTVLQNGDNATARVFLAMVEAGTGRCAEALPELGRGLSQHPDRDVRRLAGLALAQCNIALAKTAGAYAALEQLKSAFPGDADVLYLSARFYMSAWNQTVREMFDKTPASFRVNQLSAEIFETQSKYDAAIDEYRKALAKSPKTIGLHFDLGRAILRRSHDPAALDEARQQFEAELILNSNDAAAEYEIGQILLTAQKSDDALPHLERAATLAPDFPEALLALAKCKTVHGQPAEAISLLERVVKLTPRSEAARLALMLAYRNAGRMQDAQTQKEELDRLQKPPEGEFTEFLKKIGEQHP